MLDVALPGTWLGCFPQFQPQASSSGLTGSSRFLPSYCIVSEQRSLLWAHRGVRGQPCPTAVHCSLPLTPACHSLCFRPAPANPAQAVDTRPVAPIQHATHIQASASILSSVPQSPGKLASSICHIFALHFSWYPPRCTALNNSRSNKSKQPPANTCWALRTAAGTGIRGGKQNSSHGLS